MVLAMTTANVWVDWLKALYESDYRSKMSLTAFSKIAGVSRPTLFNWFEDGVRPKRSQVVTVAEALGQDTEEALRMAGYAAEERPAVSFAGAENIPVEILPDILDYVARKVREHTLRQVEQGRQTQGDDA